MKTAPTLSERISIEEFEADVRKIHALVETMGHIVFEEIKFVDSQGNRDPNLERFSSLFWILRDLTTALNEMDIQKMVLRERDRFSPGKSSC